MALCDEDAQASEYNWADDVDISARLTTLCRDILPPLLQCSAYAPRALTERMRVSSLRVNSYSSNKRQAICLQIRVTPEQLGATGSDLDMMRVPLGEQVNIRMEALLDVVDYGAVPPAERNAPIRRVIMRLRLFHLDTGTPVVPRICTFSWLKYSSRDSL